MVRKYIFSLTTLLVATNLLNICQLCFAQEGLYASQCTKQGDCMNNLSCLAISEEEPYSIKTAVRPIQPCEGSGKDLCICAKPATIFGKCDETFVKCDAAVTCNGSIDCEDSKFCFEYNEQSQDLGPDICSTDSSRCTCAVPDVLDFISCSKSSDCVQGERCAQLEELYAYKCVTCNLPPTLEGVILQYSEEEAPENCNSMTSTASSSPEPVKSPVSATDAPTNPSPEPSEALPPLISLPADSSSPSPQVDTPSPISESSSASTPPQASTSTPSSPNASTSPQASTSTPSSPNPEADNPSSSPSESEDVCISVDSLSSFEAHQLVFSEHRRGSVLCDSSGSCATPGHMVTFQGSPMTMLSYCAAKAVDGCTKMTRFVNSPRMKLGLRIASRTDGLEFTALSSRYSTKIEEWTLSAIVRLGA